MQDGERNGHEILPPPEESEIEEISFRYASQSILIGTERKSLRFGCLMTERAEGPYFVGRELSERLLSLQAHDPRAAAAHAEMAERYEALATVFGTKHLAKVPFDYR